MVGARLLVLVAAHFLLIPQLVASPPTVDDCVDIDVLELGLTTPICSGAFTAIETFHMHDLSEYQPGIDPSGTLAYLGVVQLRVANPAGTDPEFPALHVSVPTADPCAHYNLLNPSVFCSTDVSTAVHDAFNGIICPALVDDDREDNKCPVYLSYSQLPPRNVAVVSVGTAALGLDVNEDGEFDYWITNFPTTRLELQLL